MGTISVENHQMKKLIMWDQDLPENMRWTFCIEFGINIFKKAWNGNLVISIKGPKTIEI